MSFSTASASQSESDRVEVMCAACGTLNRFPHSRSADGPRCGRCKRPLVLGAARPPSTPIQVTEASWQAEVERSPLPVLADFWAPWCGPCRAVAPVLDALAGDFAGRLKIVKVNVDEQPRLAARFGVQSIPTLVLLRGGRVLSEQRGALPRPALERWLTAVL